MQFRVVPKITQFATWAEVVSSYAVGGSDLLITSRIIYDTFLGETPVGSVIIVEDFGTGEPTEDMIMAIRAAAAKKPYDRVVAVGGGSVIDIGKLLATGGWDNCQLLFQKKQTATREKQLLILPTTCGTGSEVTNISVSAFPKLGTKIGLADDALFANDAVLCAELISTLPMKVFMHSSIDALIHAIESYLSPKANAITSLFSESAIKTFVAGYRAILAGGAESRKSLLGDFILASTEAGIAFSNAGCGLIHAMSYPIGGNYHLPHGASNYEVMMAALRYYEKKAPGGRFASLLALTGPLDELEALIDALAPRTPMSEYGMGAAEAHDFALDVEKNQQRLLANCYVPTSVAEMEAIYNAIL